MSATERLRAMLDERGVEYNWTDRLSEVPSYQSVSWWFNTADRAEFREYHDGSTQLLIRSSKTNLTPEQAIAATLGPGTCQQEEHGWSTEGDHARVWLTCGHDCMVETVADLPNFCPTCGAKVVDG